MREENSLFEKNAQQEDVFEGWESLEKQSQEELTKSVPGDGNSLPEVTEEGIQQLEKAIQEVSVEAVSSEEIVEQKDTLSCEEVHSALKSKIPPYHERYYLKYCDGKRSTALDLEGTRAFLQELGFDGGELRQAREGKRCAENLRNTEKNTSNPIYCSYCGIEIAGVEFYRLPGGRMRCTTCSSTVVKTKAEVEELCRRVKTNMENFFGAIIDVPVTIEIVDGRKLKKKIGVSLGTKDSQSMLILGVAINKKKKYSIILENGAPRIALIATFAHELTHIWQYINWDNNKNFKKCPKSKRLLVYEGMAKWVEIQYLYLSGETNVAKREEYVTRNRQDEYGIGFCMYEERYPLSREAMCCEDTPFTPDHYPLD